MKRNLQRICSICFLLFGLFLVFWNLYSLDGSFSVIKFGQSGKSLQKTQSGLLLKGEKFIGSFSANANNLGGVLFRFDNRNEMSDDSVIFRLIESDTNKELYKAIYKVDQFQPRELFPFGFPIISDSENKKYIFEIESMEGREHDAIALSKIRPIFSVKYQFSKAEINSPDALIKFMFLKIQSLLSDRQFITYLLIYLSPFIIFNLITFNIKVSKRRYAYSLLPIAFILTYIIIGGKEYPLTPHILIIDWIVTIIFFRLDGEVSVLPSILFLLISIFSLPLNYNDISEKSILWMYIFLIISLFQMTLEIIVKPRIKIDTKKYIKLLFRNLRNFN